MDGSAGPRRQRPEIATYFAALNGKPATRLALDFPMAGVLTDVFARGTRVPISEAGCRNGAVYGPAPSHGSSTITTLSRFLSWTDNRSA